MTLCNISIDQYPSCVSCCLTSPLMHSVITHTIVSLPVCCSFSLASLVACRGPMQTTSPGCGVTSLASCRSLLWLLLYICTLSPHYAPHCIILCTRYIYMFIPCSSLHHAPVLNIAEDSNLFEMISYLYCCLVILFFCIPRGEITNYELLLISMYM